MSEDLITTKRLAEILGMTERRVQQLAAENVFKKFGRGRFQLADSVQKYLAYQLDLERKKYNKNDLSINEARRRREQAEASLKEIELGKQRGELLEKSDVIRVWQKILTVLKNRLLVMPSKLSPHLLGMNSVNEIKMRMDEEIFNALDELTDSRNFD